HAHFHFFLVRAIQRDIVVGSRLKEHDGGRVRIEERICPLHQVFIGAAAKTVVLHFVLRKIVFHLRPESEVGGAVKNDLPLPCFKIIFLKDDFFFVIELHKRKGSPAHIHSRKDQPHKAGYHKYCEG